MEIIRRMIALNKRQTKEQNRAFVMECPLPEYDELTHDGRLGDLARRIDKSTDDEEQRRLKGYLPFRCPHYSRFRDNYRDREHIDPESFTWQTCVDIDDAELVEKANIMSSALDSEPGGKWLPTLHASRLSDLSISHRQIMRFFVRMGGTLS